MCMGGRSDPAPAPAPEPIPQPVINASPIGDSLAPELQIAEEAMDESAKKKLKRKRVQHHLTLNFRLVLTYQLHQAGLT